MLFSSTLFLFYFLPCLLLFYFVAPTIKSKNYILLLFSFIFFAWGGLFFTLVLIVSILFNYFIGQWIEKKQAKLFLAIGIAGNIGLLVFFKYFNFIIANLNYLTSSFDILPIENPHILLPIGISFYTFHSISYLVDIHSKRSSAQKNIFDMALYIILFTQLIAGPIIRYTVFSPQLLSRSVNLENLSLGIERFIVGLVKKVLIANTIGRVADAAFAQNPVAMDSLLSALGILSYTLQIYFDFSGYSDMAIGLSRILGFKFPENFNQPYTSKSLKDFWQRWHISLSTFFKDYLYIPLGGNKKGTSRTYLNLIVVFFITGLWHGANYTFIVWGMIHGLFLLIERIGFDKFLQKVPQLVQRIYTLIIVAISWVPFRSENIMYTLTYWKSLFNWSGSINLNVVGSFFTTDVIAALIIAFTASTGMLDMPLSKLRSLFTKPIDTNSIESIKAIILLSVLFLSAVYLISGTYNPFIYYQF